MPTSESSEEIRKEIEESVDRESETEFCLVLANLYDTVDMTCPPHVHNVT